MLEAQPEHIFPQSPDSENKQSSSLLTTDILNVARVLWPDRPAIKFEERSITYQELYEEATKIAHGLLNNGVKPGDSVAVLSGNSPEYVAVYFATALMGSKFVPLNFRSNPEQLVYMLQTTNAKVIFYADRNRPSIQAVRKEIGSDIKYVSFETKMDGEMDFQELMNDGKIDEIDTSKSKDSDTTVVMFTSGTTSLPKAVEQPHKSFTESLSFPEDTERHETILVTTPLFHVAALQGVFASIVEGRTMVLLPDSKPESLLQALSRGVQRATLVPTPVEQIISHPDFSKYDLSSLEQITYGGSHMPLSVILEAMEKLPNVAFTRAYGLTETGGTVAILGPNDHKITGKETEAELEKKYYSLMYGIGKPTEGVKITIIDDFGNEIPRGENPNSGKLGRIAIKTNRVMRGYLGRPEETQGVLRGNIFVTNDLGWIDKEGNVYCVGRVDDMIIRGGEKIPPAEVETVLLQHPEIADVGVIGIPDEKWGQVVAAAISLNPGSTLSQEEIVEFCKSVLGTSKSPVKIVFIDELPRNPMGKLMRKDLQGLFVSP